MPAMFLFRYKQGLQPSESWFCQGYTANHHCATTLEITLELSFRHAEILVLSQADWRLSQICQPTTERNQEATAKKDHQSYCFCLTAPGLPVKNQKWLRGKQYEERR